MILWRCFTFNPKFIIIRIIFSMFLLGRFLKDHFLQMSMQKFKDLEKFNIHHNRNTTYINILGSFSIFDNVFYFYFNPNIFSYTGTILRDTYTAKERRCLRPISGSKAGRIFASKAQGKNNYISISIFANLVTRSNFSILIHGNKIIIIIQ